MKYISLVLALLVLALPAGAQEIPRPLSRGESLRIARDNNPAYRRALGEVEVARAEERRGRGAFFPELRLNLSTGGYISRTFTGRDEFGQPVRRDDPLEFTRSFSSQGVSLGLTLFDGGARLQELRAARASSRATRARVGAEAARLEAELARRYYDALRAQRLIRLEEDLLASARDRLAATERLLRIAVRGPVDVLGAEVGVAEQERALEQARGDTRKAVLALREEMGVLDEAPLELTDEPPAIFDPVALDADTLVRAGFRSSARIAELEAAVDAVEHRARAARGGRWPTVAISAGVGRSLSGQEFNALFDPNPPDQAIDFGLAISYPLLNGFQTSYEVARTEAALAAAQQELRAGRLAVEREVRSARIDLENAYRSADVAERSVKLNRERVELAQEQYRLGSLSLTELQDVVDRAASAERDLVNARFEFANALATLEEKTGAPIRP